MGWTLALGICQELHESIALRVPGLTVSNRLVDKCPAPRITKEQNVIHTEYVDNFVALSQEVERSRNAATQLQSAMTDSGLPTHPVECTVGGDTLGWHFDSDLPLVGVNTRTAWKIRLAFLEVLRIGSCTGQQLRILVGHFTFRALVRRELLGCLHAVYRFIEEHDGRRAHLTAPVRREMRWCAALICLEVETWGHTGVRT
eukprot:1545680-Amphidinium_carterae.3